MTRKKKSTRKKKVQVIKKIDFDSWFWKMQNQKILRPEQKSEIRVFFTQKGLQDKEEISRFNEILKLY
jgi:hypothetical protein